MTFLKLNFVHSSDAAHNTSIVVKYYINELIPFLNNKIHIYIHKYIL